MLWFKSLVQINLNLFGFLSTYTIYRVFPFDFGISFWGLVVRIALIAAMIGIAIGTVVEFSRLFLRKDGK
jgi:hypothetical protein